MRELSRYEAIVQSSPSMAEDLFVNPRWLAPLANRLRLQQPITSLAVGSSHTGVHGGCTEPAPVLLAGAESSGTCKCPLCCGSRCGSWGDRGWARAVHDWISQTYPSSGHKV